MTKPTIEEMVKWLGALRCDCEPPKMFDIDPEEMAEIIRDHLLAQEAAIKAAKDYFVHYVQDEADDVSNCVCGEQQHNRAVAFRNTINKVNP